MRYDVVALLGSLAATLSLPAPAMSPRFVDVTDLLGVTFDHSDGAGGEKHIMETISAGACLLDYDGDGDLDLYLLNGAPLPGYEGRAPLSNALYRNVEGRFVDRTEPAGLTEPGYSIGCAAADFDDDGDVDVYVTSFGKNRFYRNEGDGTFEEIGERAGVDDDRLGASAGFGDIDGDGDLDLYVTNYVSYELASPLYCGNRQLGIRTYCHPDDYEGEADVLYRNDGDGRFSDVTRDSGVYRPDGKGLGVIFFDYDDDGDADIYVANDSVMNFMFRNLGEGRFEETALASGVGFSEEGRAEAGMGVDVSDYDGDGRPDVFVTNYAFETNTLYHNLGDGTFLDATYASGLAVPSMPWVGFGARFFDMDNDGDDDLFVANGHVTDHESFLSDATSYAQKNQLYEKRDDGRFYDVSPDSGEPFAIAKVSRGVAVGDWDGDGDLDVLVTNNNDKPDLLRNENEAENGNHWTMLELVDRSGNRDGVGARVRLTSEGVSRVDEVRASGSYLSRGDVRLHFGLGAASRIERLQIRWPSGEEDDHENLPADRLLLLRKGAKAEILELAVR